MNTDASAFVRRARFLLAELKAHRYPNATSLQRFDSCSKSTAQRTIERLQSEFSFPIAFDASERGYYLTDPNFSFEFLPPGKDEYCALFLLRQLCDVVGSSDLRGAVDSLWNTAIAGKSILKHDLRSMEEHFSADLTAVATLADTGVLELVQMATTGVCVALKYRSPWRQSGEKVFRGMVERVHLSDGSVYVMFRSEKGRRMVLNASFIRGIETLKDPIDMEEPEVAEVDLGWLDGFGVWSNKELHAVTIRILPPAADYYAAQRWHVDQEDSWEDGVLVRSFPSMLSPELVRRILSLGRFVASVHPPELAAQVKEEAGCLLENVKGEV